MIFGIIPPLPNASTGLLPQESHPELPVIKLKQDEVNTAWDRLLSLAGQRQETLANAADLQRFKRYELGPHFMGISTTAPRL